LLRLTAPVPSRTLCLQLSVFMNLRIQSQSSTNMLMAGCWTQSCAHQDHAFLQQKKTHATPSILILRTRNHVYMHIHAHTCTHATTFAGETALGEEVQIVVVGQLMPPLSPPPPPSKDAARNTAKERYNFLLDLGVTTRKNDDEEGSKQKVCGCLCCVALGC